MKKIYAWIAIAILAAGGSFYGGMVYGQSTRPSFTRNGAFAAGQFAGGAGGTRTGARGGGVTTGQIIAKDATSITVKMQDGSTKIVLLGSGTQVMKTAAGTADDLTVGTNVMVAGSANSDGSVTAESVSIRPANQTPQNASGATKNPTQ